MRKAVEAPLITLANSLAMDVQRWVLGHPVRRGPGDEPESYNNQNFHIAYSQNYDYDPQSHKFEHANVAVLGGNTFKSYRNI